MDSRNYDVTAKIFNVLDNVKGFDVAMKNPSNGKIIVRHNNKNFIMTIEPIFNDNSAGRQTETLPFEEIVVRNNYIFN